MKALYYRGSVGGLEWREDPEPQILAPTDALVRPLASSTCDLDQAIVHSSVPGAEQPFAIGHEAVGEVLEVGAAVTRLRRGDVYFHTVVVPEGFTMFDIARAVEAAGLGPADEFLKVAQSETELIADIAPNAHSLEGYLFPDTYQFSRMMTMQEMAASMVCQFRAVAKQIGLISSTPAGTADSNTAESPRPGHCGLLMVQFKDRSDQPSIAEIPNPGPVERTVIMASIVEKETAVPEERPEVASVYYNRLAKRIALDADPSIIYAELLAGTYQGALHHADMSFASAYNTYRNAGLPPGPIGNPGRSSLEAAMHPAQTDYYYFVADAQGHHRFARTIEEHNKNVDAYRKAMRAR